VEAAPRGAFPAAHPRSRHSFQRREPAAKTWKEPVSIRPKAAKILNFFAAGTSIRIKPFPDIAMKTLKWITLVAGLAIAPGAFAQSGKPTDATDAKAAPAAPAAPLFPDKNLEAAVRKLVFEKRDNDKPLVEADVVNLSTLTANGAGITNLAGLEKCRALASLDLANNQVADLTPLKGLAHLQYLNLARNRVEDLAPLAGVTALQYLELSDNRVKDVAALGGLTNLASVYLARNQITDLSPLFKLPRVTSLYADGNRLTSIAGINALKRLTSLSLSSNQIKDIAPLDGLDGLYFLFLETNKISDIRPLVAMLKRDAEGEKRFAPFLNLYLKGNPISNPGQLSALKNYGTRVNP
jgi:hypothetical protein